MEVVECSATDLVGQYVGQTGPKTIKQLERGLGKVLFIDEAYRLGQGHFAKEAIDELVDNITKPRFAGKMVIILAGYDKDMNNLLRVNEGLSSRFADEILFPSLRPEDCLQLLEDKLKESQIHFPSMQDPIVNKLLLESIAEMSRLPSWGNARDVQTLAKSMVRAVYQTNTTKVHQLLLPADTALNCIRIMLSERCVRAKETAQSRPDFPGLVQSQDDSSSLPPISSGTSTATKTAAPAPKEEDGVNPKRSSEHQENPNEVRDVDVSDAIWQQLQKDKQDAQLQIERTVQKMKEQEEAHRLAKEAEKKAEEVAARLRQIKAKNDAEALELQRKREEARIREMEAKAERERILRELEKQKREELERRKKEVIVQTKLRELGVCSMGFRWIKQAGGYRCSAGSHWVNDSQLNI